MIQVSGCASIWRSHLTARVARVMLVLLGFYAMFHVMSCHVMSCHLVSLIPRSLSPSSFAGREWTAASFIVLNHIIACYILFTETLPNWNVIGVMILHAWLALLGEYENTSSAVVML